MLKIFFLILFVSLLPSGSFAQVYGVMHEKADRILGVAYYNVDQLYDTVPSKFHDDSRFTPRGKYRWDSRKYNQKIVNIARVIDSMRMPIVMLYGVESEQVVRDIVGQCDGDYAYIHRTMDYTDGLDFALLYYGDRFFPERVTSWHRALCVEGYVGSSRVAIVGNQRSTTIGVLINELAERDEETKIIILGSLNKSNFEKYGLSDHLLPNSRSGQGNRVRSGRWEMYDRIYSNFGVPKSCGVYLKQWLISEDSEPLPTYAGGKYYGGYSNYLPVYIYFGNLFAH